MKFSKIHLHALSLGLVVESEFTIWVNVFALVATRSDYTPISTTVYGQPTNANVFRHEKIAEVVTACQRSYQNNPLSLTNFVVPFGAYQSKFELSKRDNTYFGFLYLSQFYDCSVTRYKSYSNLSRIHLQDLRTDLQRTHRNLNHRISSEASRASTY